MARVRGVLGHDEIPLATGWGCAALPPGRAAHPSELETAGARWVEAKVPGTAAGALFASGACSFDAPRDFDAEDWWFRAVLDPEILREGDAVLRFGGLATLADVWLDGEHILRSDSMFLEHEVPLAKRAEARGDLVIRCASVTEDLKKKRPRPKWRTQVVGPQQIRWLRTSLLGRIPAWAPPVAPVGPWRKVSIERRTRLSVISADVRARVEAADGVVEAALRLVPASGVKIEAVSLVVGGACADLVCAPDPTNDIESVARGVVRLAEVPLWWPHTHGAPTLHSVEAIVRTSAGEVRIDLGKTGFRKIELDRTGDGFSLRVNGIPVFCRGASWMPLDPVGFAPSHDALRAALEQVRACNMNMVRLSGTMTYEPMAFHDLCDELGILVWQDFMFANMDYPVQDEPFAALVRAEAIQLADRLQLSPSLALLCGGSEVAQQASMLGRPASEWYSPLFTEVLPNAARALRPDVPYCASTPEGGAMPFRVDSGVSHYYGVGAYQRPLEDARRARVRFTSECLAFANVPSDETIEAFLNDGEIPTNHPRWKARVPRDKGPAWDFDDVRDHYLRRLFGLDPSALRYADLPRYLELARVVTGETMHATISEWRRTGSECHGALVWFLRDLWPGAGWGVVDAFGRPKAAWHYLKRAFAPVALFSTDEGVNGLSLHGVNDGPTPIEADLSVVLYRLGEQPVAEGKTRVTVPARGATHVPADAILGRFTDTTYAYRFGPPGHDVVVATLADGATGARLGQTFHFPLGLPSARHPDLGLEASATPEGPGAWRVTVRSRRLAQSIAFDARGFVADDEFFHLAPGDERTTTLRGPGASLSARVIALNAATPTKISLEKD